MNFKKNTESVLYRKYRPLLFSEVIAQNKVTKSIQYAFSLNRLSHAFLFIGPKGSGKTTVARLLSRLLNCESPHNNEPCNRCSNCLNALDNTHPDIQEIDAASNRGIDNIRQIISTIGYNATLGQFRIIIMDEAHMLTPEAFNALLKTLEDPPDNVVFILTTTDFHKIPPTIASRCSLHRFTPISRIAITNNLIQIAKKEDIKISPEAAELLASESEGSMRNSLMQLQQIRDYAEGKEITASIVYEFIGSIDSKTLGLFLDLVIKEDLQSLLILIHDILDSGADLTRIPIDLSEYMRKIFLVSVSPVNMKSFYSSQLEQKTIARQAESMGTAKSIQILEIIHHTNSMLMTSVSPRILIEAMAAYMIFPEKLFLKLNSIS